MKKVLFLALTLVLLISSFNFVIFAENELFEVEIIEENIKADESQLLLMTDYTWDDPVLNNVSKELPKFRTKILHQMKTEEKPYPNAYYYIYLIDLYDKEKSDEAYNILRSHSEIGRVLRNEIIKIDEEVSPVIFDDTLKSDDIQLLISIDHSWDEEFMLDIASKLPEFKVRVLHHSDKEPDPTIYPKVYKNIYGISITDNTKVQEAFEYLSSFGEDVMRVSYNEMIPLCQGDVNGDGEVDSLDATSVLKYDAGIIDLDAAQLASSDVNNDGVADSLDATLILKYDAGLIDVFISDETEPSETNGITNEPPKSAYLSSEDIVKLVSMDQTDRKAITSYIQSGALLDDESCLEFMEILYSTDIITVDGKLPRSIIYYPETKDLTVIYKVSSSTHWYCFEYILNGETAENRLNTVINTENAVTYNEKLTLLCIPEIEDKDIARHNSYCWVQINGKLAKGTYCNKNEEITNDVWDSMFSSEVIISPLLKEN